MSYEAHLDHIPNARLQSKSLEPSRIPYPVESSQSMIVLSRDAEAIMSPEGRNATDDTLWSCPNNVLMHL
jgi:hypothetical protein